MRSKHYAPRTLVKIVCNSKVRARCKNEGALSYVRRIGAYVCVAFSSSALAFYLRARAVYSRKWDNGHRHTDHFTLLRVRGKHVEKNKKGKAKKKGEK